MKKSPKPVLGRVLLQRRVFQLKAILVVLVTVVSSLVVMSPTSAAQLSSRSVTIDSSKSGETGVTYNFGFTLPTTAATTVQGLIFEFCTTPLGSCTKPTGMVVNAGTVAPGVQTGFPGSAAFTEQTTALNDCSGITNATTDTKYCLIRTEPATTTGGVAVTMPVNNVTNPTTASHVTVYVRVSVYSNATFANAGLLHTGTVAAAITQQLTVNARVQERLEFCVGTTSVADGTTSPGADCTAITGNTVDLGIVDFSAVNVTPVATASGGNNVNGVAMVRSNAANGTVVSYYSEQNNSSGALKVPGATCSGTSTTDQCFNSNATQTAIASGTEGFGMTVSHVNRGSNSGSYAGTNLVRDGQYDGDGTPATGFAWQTSGALTSLATSAGSALKVLDDEALILRFAATSSLVTPTGQYSVVSTYIATSTY